jgi:hypothetical protein
MELKRTVQTLEIELQSQLALVCTHSCLLLCFKSSRVKQMSCPSWSRRSLKDTKTEKGKLFCSLGLGHGSLGTVSLAGQA